MTEPNNNGSYKAFCKVGDLFRHLYSDKPRLNIKHEKNQIAIEEFLDRVKAGLVFGEISNPVENDLAHAATIGHDRVCFQITEVDYCRRGGIFSMVLVPFGPMKDVLSDIDESTIALDARGLVEFAEREFYIKQLTTFDLSYVYKI